MRPPYGAGAPNVVRNETRLRLAGRRGELETMLAALLVRMTAPERRAFWLGVMLADGSVDHRQALAAWVRRLDPDMAEVIAILPPAPQVRPERVCGYCGAAIPLGKGRPPKICKADACQARRRAGDPLPLLDARPLVEV